MKKILIADDAKINREILKEIFVGQFEILEASDGAKAVKIIEENIHDLVLVLLDLVMPKKNGLEVMEYMTMKGYIEWIPVIMITGESTIESDVKAYEYGAADIIYKPFSSKVVKRRAFNIIELYQNRRNIEKQLAIRTKQLVESQAKLERNNEFLVNALSSVVEFRSLESGEHISRVRKITGIMLKHLVALYPEYSYLKQDIPMIVNASALHDIGKIAIPDSILLKPGRLTQEEFEIMKSHTTQGCEILENFKQDETDFYKYSYDICRYHHERYDGKGYPDHLKGDEIPIWAQAVSIVDVYDALISPRVYKEPYRADEAIRMIHDGECGVFSNKILECFDSAKFEILVIIKGNSL